MRFLPPLAVMGLIFFLSAQPDLSSGLGGWDLILRKLAHMAIFGALFLAWAYALRGETSRGALEVAAALALAYAISDEIHQHHVAGRHGTPVDVGIDALGIAVAAALRTRFPRALRG
jgi:VanZ family protein